MERKYLVLVVLCLFFTHLFFRRPKKTNTGIPLITAKVVKGGTILEPNEFIAEEDYTDWMTRGLPDINDVVLTTEAPLGEVALIKNKNVALAQRIITLRGKSDFLFNPFLKYYFQSNQGQYELESRASGTTVFGIKSSVSKEVPILLPPLPEQRAIAGVLSSLDNKIDMLHRQNKTLEAMAETLFRQWFVEEAEDSWEEGVLGDYADNIRVNIPKAELVNHSYYVGLEHIPRKQITLDSWDSTEKIESNKSLFLKNDILFGKLRSYFHKVVFASIDGVCSTDILVIRPKQKDWFAFCLFWFFSKEVVEHSDLGSGGTRMPRTSWKILSDYKIPKPPMGLISKFDKITKEFFIKMQSNQSQIRTLEKLRDTLLPKLMSGEVRV